MKKLQLDQSIKNIKDFVNEELNKDKYKSIPKPHVILIKVGEGDPRSNFYIEKKRKACEDLGIKFKIYEYKSTVTTEHLKSIISRLSLDPLVTGIIIQDPLPIHINKFNLIQEIDPNKDIEGITMVQSGLSQSNLGIGCINSPEALAIADIIYTNTSDETPMVSYIDETGKSSISSYLSKMRYGNIINCSYITDTLIEFINKSDIIITQSYCPKYFKSRYFYGKSNKIIIDNSLIYDNDILCPSIDIEDIENNVSISNTFKYITIEDGLIDLIAEYTAFNVFKTYEYQFDFIWKYCQNLNLKD